MKRLIGSPLAVLLCTGYLQDEPRTFGTAGNILTPLIARKGGVPARKKTPTIGETKPACPSLPPSLSPHPRKAGSDDAQLQRGPPARRHEHLLLNRNLVAPSSGEQLGHLPPTPRPPPLLASTVAAVPPASRAGVSPLGVVVAVTAGGRGQPGAGLYGGQLRGVHAALGALVLPDVGHAREPGRGLVSVLSGRDFPTMDVWRGWCCCCRRRRRFLLGQLD